MKILRWNLQDELRWLLFWIAAVAVIIGFVVAVFPEFGGVFENMIFNVPMVKVFMGRFAPELADCTLLDAFLCLEFFSWFGVMAAFYPLIFASNAVAGEIDNQTMELLLAQPVSRIRALIEKYTAMAINLAALCAASFAVLWISVSIYLEESPSTWVYFSLFLNSYFLLLAIAAFGFLCSVMINSQRAALSVSSGLIMLSFVIDKGLNALDAPQWLTCLIPFRYADPTRILYTKAVNWGDNFILVLFAAVFLFAALALFRQKDIAA